MASDKPMHASGCIIQPHQGVCVVSDPSSMSGVTYALMMDPAFVPRLTGDTDYDQIQAALRVAPGSTHIQHKYRWRHLKSGTITDQLSACQDPKGWVREVCVHGAVWSTWKPLG